MGASSSSWARSIRKDARARNDAPIGRAEPSHVTRPRGASTANDSTAPSVPRPTAAEWGAAGCFRVSSARGGTGTERSAERPAEVV